MCPVRCGSRLYKKCTCCWVYIFSNYRHNSFSFSQSMNKYSSSLHTTQRFYPYNVNSWKKKKNEVPLLKKTFHKNTQYQLTLCSAQFHGSCTSIGTTPMSSATFWQSVVVPLLWFRIIWSTAVIYYCCGFLPACSLKVIRSQPRNGRISKVAGFCSYVFLAKNL